MPTILTEKEFLKYHSSYPNQYMWFLGAGISRTAGMPTATDLIWDLKIKFYCREENQNLDSHDANNDVIKDKVQKYMDSCGFPKLWSPEEYSFYFDLTFGKDYALQQKYLMDKLNDDHISLNIGHRALAGLIHLNKARLLFTTNFDGVIEKAVAEVGQSSISTYNLEGSYAALDALNQERFPIYAKIHGDFRYQSVKNLSTDLLSNDREIQKCFVAAATRFGVIISGYSGRDHNVMQMFNEAIGQNNAFPFGLFWTATSLGDVLPAVHELIEEATKKGIKAYLVETGTFDSTLSKIWNQTSDKPETLEQKVRTALAQKVNIPFSETGKGFPILRTNALPLVTVPTECAMVETAEPLTYSQVKELVIANKPHSIITKADQVLAWGAEEEITKGLGVEQVKSISKMTLADPVELVSKNKIYHAFYERSLAFGITTGKPLLLHNDKGFVISIDPAKKDDPYYAPLANELKDNYGNIPQLAGYVPKLQGVVWSEAIKVKIECRHDKLFLIIRPTIWIEPKAERQKSMDFIRSRVLRRYNTNTHKLLNAWIKILLGTTGSEAEISSYSESNYPSVFKINTRTAYSRI